MNPLGVIIIGLFAGGFIAITGMMKDTQYEPFKLHKFIRSPIIAVIWSLIGWTAFEISDHWVLLGHTAGFERLTVEVWKAFIRPKKPSKFKSPTKDSQWIKPE